uniref:HDC11480 n=1 Tax=Drosophila melanogaster TaxID=7227 RepID=Q6IKT8_DROME|nr:TPA_inf: HDC11480 [Drosophila melanogaster]
MEKKWKNKVSRSRWPGETEMLLKCSPPSSSSASYEFNFRTPKPIKTPDAAGEKLKFFALAQARGIGQVLEPPAATTRLHLRVVSGPPFRHWFPRPSCAHFMFEAKVRATCRILGVLTPLHFTPLHSEPSARWPQNYAKCLRDSVSANSGPLERIRRLS